jgi:chromosome segregation ATPase
LNAVDQSLRCESKETAKTVEEYEAMLAQLRSDYEVSEIRRQDEVHTYCERIDALQAKLHFLTSEIVEATRSTAASALAGSYEMKLAQQSEKIALLMEEGEKLSGNELKHLATIKMLRTKLSQADKNLGEAQRRADKAEKSQADLKEKLKRAEAAEKRALDRLKAFSSLEGECEKLRTQCDSKDELIASLRSEATEARSKVAEKDKKDQQVALQVAQKQLSELRSELSTARTEKELVQEKLRAEVRELQQTLERERERFQLAEADFRREQAVSAGDIYLIVRGYAEFEARLPKARWRPCERAQRRSPWLRPKMRKQSLSTRSRLSRHSTHCLAKTGDG